MTQNSIINQKLESFENGFWGLRIAAAHQKLVHELRRSHQLFEAWNCFVTKFAILVKITSSRRSNSTLFLLGDAIFKSPRRCNFWILKKPEKIQNFGSFLRSHQNSQIKLNYSWNSPNPSNWPRWRRNNPCKFASKFRRYFGAPRAWCPRHSKWWCSSALCPRREKSKLTNLNKLKFILK